MFTTPLVSDNLPFFHYLFKWENVAYILNKLKLEVSFHSFCGENFFKICFVVVHKIYNFAMQSRAFLSQLLVTGDESGFFYLYTPETNLIDFFFFPILFCLYY